MKTQQEALNWISQQLGKSLDFDGHYGSQCVDLVEFYLQFLGIAPFYGNAKDFWESGFNGGGQLVRSSVGQPGAIAVFKPNAGNGYAGHISCEHDDYPTTFRSMDQNWYNSGPNGSPAAWVTHTKDNSIYGYLIPKFTNQGGNQVWLDKSVVDDYEAWKKTGQQLSFDPAYPAMGGTPGKPLTGDTKGITTVMDDFRKNKAANEDAQPYKTFVAVDNATVWKSVEGDLSKLEVVTKGSTATPATDLKAGLYRVV